MRWSRKLGTHCGIRTHTIMILNHLPLPVGLNGQNLEDQVGLEPTVFNCLKGSSLRHSGHWSIMAGLARFELATKGLTILHSTTELQPKKTKAGSRQRSGPL
jgi:hypothetical protein